jgi:hypothetical protein
MKNSEEKKGGGLFRKIRSKLSHSEKQHTHTVALEENGTESETVLIMEEYSAIRQNPDKLTGWDFDRAFAFIEKYPDSDYVNKLKEAMYAVSRDALKGLSYPSAVKILQQMPDHSGVRSIVSGMRKLEDDYIRELRSDVVAYILEIIPDHPLRSELAAALAEKNLTVAHDFIERNPDHPSTRSIIQAMFDRDPNIATLLLHERMDHPKVDAIFNGIYSIPKGSVNGLMPDAIIFLIEVASDHPYADQMLQALVDKNYIKAFDFVMNNPDHQLAQRLTVLIGQKKPELIPLLEKKR